MIVDPNYREWRTELHELHRFITRIHAIFADASQRDFLLAQVAEAISSYEAAEQSERYSRLTLPLPPENIGRDYSVSEICRLACLARS